MQTLHYVKWPGGAADIRARTEVLAARLYQLAGAPTPMVSLIDFGGKKAVKSDWIDGVEPMTTAKMRNHSDVTDHFVADAWLANWDVVGTSSDNIVKGPGNKAYRIDLGGSLLFRAQGKPKAFTGDVAELESMRNASQAPQASQVFGQMKLKDLKKSAKGVTGITDHQINQAVDAAGIPHTTSSDYPMKHGGTQSKDLNEWLKAVLKSRRDDIVKKVVKKKLPKEVSLAALKKASELDEKSLQLLLDKSGSLVAGGDSTTKRSVHDQICKNELGAQEGQEAAQTVRSHYSTWKGHTTTDQGNALRWASAEAFGKGKEARAALRAFWRYQAKGKTASQRKAHVAQRAQALDAHLASNGKALVEGVKANNAAHNALLRIQLVPKNKLKPGAKIVLYRGWKPDQVQAFGWSGAKPGDKITMSRPIVFSFSPNHSTANGFGHGGLVTKAEVPVRRVVLSDRLTYSKGSYVSEDEALWVAPGTKLEVMHAP